MQQNGKQGMLVAVKALLVRDARALLLRRSHTDHSAPGSWEFPGGGVEVGEKLDEALRREVQEEAGLDAQVQRILYADSVMTPSARQIVIICYLCTVKQGVVRLSYEHDDYCWATRTQMREMLGKSVLHNLDENDVWSNPAIDILE